MCMYWFIGKVIHLPIWMRVLTLVKWDLDHRFVSKCNPVPALLNLIPYKTNQCSFTKFTTFFAIQNQSILSFVCSFSLGIFMWVVNYKVSVKQWKIQSSHLNNMANSSQKLWLLVTGPPLVFQHLLGATWLCIGA